MKKYFVCRTKSYKTYIVLPDNWSCILRSILSGIIDLIQILKGFQNEYSLSKSILGPHRMFLYIIVTPLRPGEAEPSIETSEEFFEGFSYRQHLFEESTSKIEVLSKEHFTAKYYRINPRGAQYLKKYCLYIERLEYLITAVLANVAKNAGRPDELEIIRRENIYDNIVQSLFLVAK